MTETTTYSRPDPNSPFVFSIRELERRAGTMRPIRCEIPAPSGFGSDMLAVPTHAELELDARLEAVVEGVVFTGTVRAAVCGECSRCLDDIVDDIEVEICELYAYPDSTTDQTSDADEVSRVRDEMIDTESAIRDAVLLAISVTPKCREDCPGLCAECGEHRDRLPADHSHVQSDIRWAALYTLKKHLATGVPTGGTNTGSKQSNPKAEQEN